MVKRRLYFKKIVCSNFDSPSAGLPSTRSVRKCGDGFLPPLHQACHAFRATPCSAPAASIQHLALYVAAAPIKYPALPTEARVRVAAAAPTTCCVPTQHLAVYAAGSMNAIKDKGGRPAEPQNQGVATIVMLVFIHLSNLAEVFYPDNWKLGYKRKAEALQATINADFASGLIAPEYPGEDSPHEGSPLIKVDGKPFKEITYRSPEAFNQFLLKSTDTYNSQVSSPITVTTFKKDLIGLGFSIQCKTGTLTFELVKWNTYSYRVQAGGVSTKVGCRPNVCKQAIAEVPQFYRDFGTLTAAAAVATTATFTPTVVNTVTLIPPAAAGSAATSSIGPSMGMLPPPTTVTIKGFNSVRHKTTSKRRTRENSVDATGEDSVQKKVRFSEADDMQDEMHNLIDAPDEYHNLSYDTLEHPSQMDREGRTFRQAFVASASGWGLDKIGGGLWGGVTSLQWDGCTRTFVECASGFELVKIEPVIAMESIKIKEEHEVESVKDELETHKIEHEKLHASSCGFPFSVYDVWMSEKEKVSKDVGDDCGFVGPPPPPWTGGGVALSLEESAVFNMVLSRDLSLDEMAVFEMDMAHD